MIFGVIIFRYFIKPGPIAFDSRPISGLVFMFFRQHHAHICRDFDLFQDAIKIFTIKQIFGNDLIHFREQEQDVKRCDRLEASKSPIKKDIN